MPETTKNAARAADKAQGLRALADMIEANPDVVEHINWTFDGINVPVWTKEAVQVLARAGAASRIKVTKHQGDKYAGVDLYFADQVSLHVYVKREEVCERIVTGTREVTEEVPDPDVLAAVPKVAVTKVVEEVTWRCMPLLAAEVSA